MLPSRYLLLLLLLAVTSAAAAKDSVDGMVESINCYQNGQLILKTQDRIREFLPTNSMVLIADVSLGQVRETRVKLYTSEHADIVCVVTDQK